MRIYSKVLFFALGLLYGVSWAVILFEDDFFDQQYSYRNWTFISADESVLHLNNNVAFILNKSDSYSALAVHRSAIKTPVFTISAKISSEYPGSGLYFCFQELRGGYSGYGALLSDDGIYIYKFFPESLVVIAEQTSSFVRMGENRLTVSKNNDLITIFCNGYFICSVRDGEFSDGDMAFIVPPLSESSFDDFKLEDCFSDTLHFASFFDDFLQKSSFGWTKYGNALTIWKNSHLQISTSPLQEYYTGIEIPLNSFHMKTVVRFDDGDSSSIYGFFVKVTNDSSNSPLFYQFAISGDRKFVIKKRDQENQYLSSQPITGKSFNINDSGAVFNYDFLELTRDENNFTFFANGLELDQNEITGEICGAGLFVSKELKVSFDEFQISDLEMPTEVRKTKTKNGYTIIARRKPITFDMLGRCLLEQSTPVPSKVTFQVTSTGIWKKKLITRGGERLR